MLVASLASIPLRCHAANVGDILSYKLTALETLVAEIEKNLTYVLSSKIHKEIGLTKA